jgi:aminodeoxyfutalosine deaminase
MTYLHRTQIPLEVCPTSNICLKVFETYEQHCLPQLMDAGLFITINSDDPPMFNTTLTNEYRIGKDYYQWDQATIQGLVMNAVEATLLPTDEKDAMRAAFQAGFNSI